MKRGVLKHVGQQGKAEVASFLRTRAEAVVKSSEALASKRATDEIDLFVLI